MYVATYINNIALCRYLLNKYNRALDFCFLSKKFEFLHLAKFLSNSPNLLKIHFSYQGVTKMHRPPTKHLDQS